MELQDLKAAIDGYSAATAAALKQTTTDIEALLDRIEELESKSKVPGKNGGGQSAEAREHRKRFDAWLRRPHDSATKQALGDFESKMTTKSVSVGSSAGGGYAVPEEIVREIERMEMKFSPVRSLVKVIRVSTGDVKHLVNLRGATAGWVGESDSRTETATPQLREVVPTFGELYAYPQTSEWALDDIFFDVGSWLAEEVAEQFAVEEGSAVLTGNGSNKPTGMLNTTPVTTADFASPLRAAAAYQYIANTSSPTGTVLLADSLIDLLYSVNSRYRANGTWVMNSTTAAAVRKLKDLQGQYLWAPGLVAGQPDLLLGYPVSIWEQLDNVGVNNFPIAFGDFRKGYLLCDRTEIRITVDANITTPGKIKYFVRRREGGHVLVNDAIKFLRTV
jgi:HK97 family phage major capsid protein